MASVHYLVHDMPRYYNCDFDIDTEYKTTLSENVTKHTKWILVKETVLLYCGGGKIERSKQLLIYTLMILLLTSNN